MADLNIGNSSSSVVVNAKHNGSVTPQINNTYDLGTSDLRWKNIYGGTFVGSLSGNAATATKATQDSTGQQINTTYIKGLSVSGRTITYTKGDGSTGTITTQDTNTTYGVATSSANGLMSSADKSKLDGIAAGANNYSHPTSSGNKHIPAGGSSGQILRWSADGTAAWGADTNTWRGIQNNLTSDSTNDSLAAAQGKVLKTLVDQKLEKTTYEYNKELALGNSGKVCIGKFPCYDSNISVEIKSTTNTTYNGTLIIATQNINTSLGGVYKAVVYGDENNTLTNSIKIEYLSGSNVFSVYINLPSWSKNILHIQCVSLAGAPANIATTVDSIPSTATIVPTNAFIHTHSYAGSSSVGGSATSAVKLDSSAGSATQPVYFSNGKPVATTYTLGSSVPSNAKFTDTTYSAGTGLSLSGTTFNHKNSVTAGTAQGDASKTLAFGGTFTIPTITYDAQGHITGKGTTTMTMPANPNTDTHWTTGITAGETGTTSNSATTNGNTFIKIKDNSTHRGQIKLVGSGATSVSSNAEGVITISSTDNNTTYGSMSVNEGTTGTATTNRVLTAANLKGIINAHAPTKTGGGASGTWGISISGNAASASKVNNKLTVGSKSYDGSAAVTITASDLGLASAMLFLGTTTTAIADGATTNPVVLGGSNKTVTAGNVVLYGSKEFVWTGGAWEELGNEGSYKIVQAAVVDPSASGTSNTFIDTISQDTNGKITVTKKTVAVTNSAPTLAWGTTSTIGTVAGTNLQVKMPDNPNTDTKVTQTVTTSNAAYPLLLAPNGQTATTTTTSYFDSGVTLNPSTNTIAANVSGNAATATKLATARTIQTNLASTSAASFDGSSNITPGVTGTLPIANGGTGATTASTARDNLGAQSKVLYGNSAPSDSIGSNGDIYIALESDDIKKDIVDLIYPVGSIYISMNPANPSTLFGGTWQAFEQGTGNNGTHMWRRMS